MFNNVDDSRSVEDEPESFRSVADADYDIDIPTPLNLCKPGLEDSMGLGDVMRGTMAFDDNFVDDVPSHTSQLSTKYDSWSRPELISSKNLHPSLKPQDNKLDRFAFDDFEDNLPSSTAAKLEPVPPFYSKQSAFISQSSPAVLLRDLDQLLKASEMCVHEFQEHKSKVKGIARINLDSCHFAIKVYDFGALQLLVEVQNRGGCVVAFSTFYRLILRELSSMSASHVTRRALDNSDSDAFENVQSLKPCRLPVLSDEEDVCSAENETELLSLTSRMLEDAECGMLETQRQAMYTLASLMAEPSTSSVTLPHKRAGILGVLRAALRSSDEEVLEHACSLLVNVCTMCASSRTTICCEMLTNLFDVLDSPGSLENRSCKRRVAEALVLLSNEPHHAKRLKANHHTLQKYQGYDDLSLKRSIATTLQRVEAA